MAQPHGSHFGIAHGLGLRRLIVLRALRGVLLVENDFVRADLGQLLATLALGARGSLPGNLQVDQGVLPIRLRQQRLFILRDGIGVEALHTEGVPRVVARPGGLDTG